MSTPIVQRIRLLIDAQKWYRPQLLDVLTQAAPIIASGADIQFELEILDGAPALLDYTNVASVTVELSQRANPLNNNVLFSRQILTGAINPAATLGNFNNGSDQAIVLPVPNTSTQLALTASASNYTLAVYATSGDVTAKNRPLLLMDLQAVDANLPLANPSLPAAFKIGVKMPFVCGDGQTRDVSLQQTANNHWTLFIGNPYNGPGQASYSLFCADNLYRDLTVILVNGAWTIDINQAGHS